MGEGWCPHSPPPPHLASPLEIPSILTLKLGKLINSWAFVPTVLMDYYLLVHVNNFPKKVESVSFACQSSMSLTSPQYAAFALAICFMTI